MKKLILIFLIAVITLGAIGLKPFLGLAKIEEIQKPKAYVASLEQKAEIKKVNEDWKNLELGMELNVDDEIKTDDNGFVVLNFFDNSTARIDANTQIKLEKLAIDNDNYAKNNVEIKVVTGRIWSRILKLMDKESSYEVGTNATVATVRGTAFDFEVTKEGFVNIRVIENKVNFATKKDEKNIYNLDLEQGYSSQVNQNGPEEDLKKLEKKEIDSMQLESDWFQKNEKEDLKFLDEIKKKRENINKEIAGNLPETFNFKLKTIAEKLDLLLTRDSKDRQELELSFANRRLAESIELFKQGKDDLARKNILDYKERIKNFESLSEQNKAIILNQINLNEGLDDSIKSKDGLVDIFAFVKKNETEESGEEIKDLIKEEIKENATSTLIDLDQASSSEIKKEEIKPLINLEKPVEKQTLEKPVDLLPEKIVEEKPLIKEPLTIKPIVEEKIAEEVKEKVPLLEEKIIPEIIKEVKPTRLIVSSARVNMPSNKTNQCKAILEYSDGSTKDVTANSSWSLSGDIGAISQSGLLSADEDGGKGIVSASYTENGASFSGSSQQITALTLEF